MGDIVELFMAIEEMFDVEIPDEEVVRLATVGQIHRWLINQRQHKYPNAPAQLGPCLTSASFYRVRRALIEACGLEKRGITPKTSLETLLPPIQLRRERRLVWEQLRQTSGGQLPPLELSPALQCFIPLAFFIVLCSSPVWGLIVSTSYSSGIHLGFLGFWVPVAASFIFWGVITILSKPYAVFLPKEIQTVGDVAYQSLGATYQRIEGPINDKDLEKVLCVLIAGQAGVGLDKVKPETRLIEDLHLD